MRPTFIVLALLVSLPLAADRPPREPPDFTVDAAGRRQLVDDLLRELDKSYVFPERLAERRAELVRRWSAPAFVRLTSARAIAKALDGDLAELFHDPHLGVRVARPDRPLPSATPSPAELAAMEAQLADEHYGVVRVEICEGNIGYVKLDSFAPADSPGTQRAISDAMSFVADTRALILDVRDNHGGDGEAVALVMSYLLDHKRLLLEEYWRPTNQRHEDWTPETVSGRRYGEKRPVWVLTSRETFSAAEELAYDVQTLKRGAIVGERTGGGANHNLFAVVGGRFVASIPIGTTRSPVTGTNWEGTGVKPEIAVPGARALEVALAEARRAVGPRRDP